MAYFKFPVGATEINIRQQRFVADFKDKEGNNFFRAPDNFAEDILGTGMGFEQVPKPDGAPDDFQYSNITAVSPESAAKIEDQEIQLSHLRAELATRTVERDENMRLLNEAETQLKNAEFDLEEANKKIKDLEEKASAKSK